VHIERKGEPSLEFTPFTVDGLRDDVALEDLLSRNPIGDMRGTCLSH